MAEIMMFSDIVEENGKTIRENNMEKIHKIPIGSVVDVELDECLDYEPGTEYETFIRGKARLVVVAHNRDCDGTPLYSLAGRPILPPIDNRSINHRNFYNALVGYYTNGYSEGSLSPVKDLVVEVRTWESVVQDFRNL